MSTGTIPARFTASSAARTNDRSAGYAAMSDVCETNTRTADKPPLATASLPGGVPPGHAL
jgi:hypothetical protein